MRALSQNIDVGFGEAQYGILASVGFAALFSLSALVAGGLVDRGDPRKLLTGSSVLWAGATAATGAAHSFTEVLGARMLSGVGQAFTNPASYTILSRYYPEEKRASVTGLFASSVYAVPPASPRPGRFNYLVAAWPRQSPRSAGTSPTR